MIEEEDAFVCAFGERWGPEQGITDNRLASPPHQGGIITLLDPQGLKIHGVSYTKQQAAVKDASSSSRVCD